MKHRMKATRRRGTVYIAVLAVAMIVVLIGVTGIAVARSQKRAIDALGNAAEARFYALAGIEIGRVWISQNSNWRTAYAASLFANQPVGAGTYTLTMTNATGVTTLDNTPSDPVTLASTGVKGRARQIISVTMAPGGVSIDVPHRRARLRRGPEFLQAATIQPASQIAASNISISTNNSAVYTDVETVGSYSGGNYYGQTTSGVPARTMPDSTVWSYYQTYGTVIPSATMSSNKLEASAACCSAPRATPSTAPRIPAASTSSIARTTASPSTPAASSAHWCSSTPAAASPSSTPTT